MYKLNMCITHHAAGALPCTYVPTLDANSVVYNLGWLDFFTCHSRAVSAAAVARVASDQSSQTPLS